MSRCDYYRVMFIKKYNLNKYNTCLGVKFSSMKTCLGSFLVREKLVSGLFLKNMVAHVYNVILDFPPTPRAFISYFKESMLWLVLNQKAKCINLIMLISKKKLKKLKKRKEKKRNQIKTFWSCPRTSYPARSWWPYRQRSTSPRGANQGSVCVPARRCDKFWDCVGRWGQSSTVSRSTSWHCWRRCCGPSNH